MNSRGGGFIFIFHERTQKESLISRNIEFKCENPTNKDSDIIYEQNAIVLRNDETVYIS